MSRPRSAVPKYRHHKPTGQAFIRVAGRNIYLGKHGSEASRQEYARRVGELAASPTHSLPIATAGPGALTVVELVAAYLEFAQGYYQRDGKPTRHLEAIKLALRLLRRLYGRTPVAKFGPLCLRAIQGKLVEAKNARTYINGQVDKIKRVFKWGVSVELVPAAVYQALATVPGLKRGRTPAREPEPVQPVDDLVVDSTLPYLPAVVADMIRLQRFTGARPGEVCALRPMDLDRSGEVWTYRPESHKTEYLGRQRIIYIGPRAQDVLRPYLLRPADAFCFSPADSEAARRQAMRDRRKTRVQPSQANRRKPRPKRPPRASYDKNAYLHAVVRAVEKANRERTKQAAEAGIDPELLPAWHPNQVRHTAATEIRRRFGLEAAQVALGHAKADVTQVYAERDARLAVEVARKIG